MRFDLSTVKRGLLLPLAPYLLLLCLLLSAWPIQAMGSGAALFWWMILRWLLRLIFVGTTVIAWRSMRPQPYTDALEHTDGLWLYSWLGFAVYEAVALLLAAATAVLDQASGAVTGISGLVLLGFAFLPYCAVAFWLGRRDQQVAAYTIFPHAALTAPLFFLAFMGDLNSHLDTSLIAICIAPTVFASIVVLLFPWFTRWDQRLLVLGGGMVLCQLLFALGVAIQQQSAVAILLFLPFAIFGAFILSGPFILVTSWTILRHLLQNGVGPTRLARWQQALLNLLGSQLLRTANRHIGETSRDDARVAVAPTQQSSQPIQFSGGQTVTQSISEAMQTAAPPSSPPSQPEPKPLGPGMERLFKLSTIVLAAMVVLGIVLFVGRAAVYKIHEYERGLHLRGGRFLAVQEPGWHLQIPLVDTVIIVKINERLGYVEQIPAMTSDNVTMIVSLQYTYRVTDPEQYALQVDDPERIVFEFVQGKLRDVVNTKAMADVMNDRALMNQQVMDTLKEKEDQYGVKFVTVQMQSASPPDEVLSAIKDRMVASQRQEQAQAEAAQQRTIAEAELYSAQKRAEAEAYGITRTAEANAERVRLMTEAQQLSIRSVLVELDGKGELATKFLDYLIAQELKENSKWIINGEGTPLVNVQD
ncbi:MAG: SPFH domain-containing protein [Caldilineaceae bacterium]